MAPGDAESDAEGRARSLSAWVKGTYHRLKLVGLAPRAERNHAFHRALVELR